MCCCLGRGAAPLIRAYARVTPVWCKFLQKLRPPPPHHRGGHSCWKVGQEMSKTACLAVWVLEPGLERGIQGGKKRKMSRISPTTHHTPLRGRIRLSEVVGREGTKYSHISCPGARWSWAGGVSSMGRNSRCDSCLPEYFGPPAHCCVLSVFSH